jgi:hypothetical protein
VSGIAFRPAGAGRSPPLRTQDYLRFEAGSRGRVEPRHAFILAAVIGAGVLAYTMYRIARLLEWFQ